MDLRVWVDGIQRVVSGVRLTTTCQEIVFALAHATQQTGRFTMVERWRNNERLLSPNEQLLVTLQRWGDQMQEVEFILRRSNSNNSSSNLQQIQPQQPSIPQQTVVSQAENSETNQQQQFCGQIVSFSNRVSPISSTASSTTIDKYFDANHRDMQTQIRSSASLNIINGSLTKINHNTQEISDFNKVPNSNGTNSSETSSLSSSQNNNNNNIQHQIYSSTTTHNISSADNNLQNNHSNSGNFLKDATGSAARNGYDGRKIVPTTDSNLKNSISHVAIPNQLTSESDNVDDQLPKNYPYEDLYSTVCKPTKKNNNPPPAIPAKPRIIPMPISMPMKNYANQFNGPIQTAPGSRMLFSQTQSHNMTSHAQAQAQSHPPHVHQQAFVQHVQQQQQFQQQQNILRPQNNYYMPATTTANWQQQQSTQQRFIYTTRPTMRPMMVQQDCLPAQQDNCNNNKLTSMASTSPLASSTLSTNNISQIQHSSNLSNDLSNLGNLNDQNNLVTAKNNNTYHNASLTNPKSYYVNQSNCNSSSQAVTFVDSIYPQTITTTSAVGPSAAGLAGGTTTLGLRTVPVSSSTELSQTEVTTRPEKQNSLGSNILRFRCASSTALNQNQPSYFNSLNQHNNYSPQCDGQHHLSMQNSLQSLSSQSYNDPNDAQNRATLQPAMLQPQFTTIDRSRSEANLMVINRGSAINVRLPPSDQTVMARAFNEISNKVIDSGTSQKVNQNSTQSVGDTDLSVAKVGKDMLQVIDAQKKLLLEQRDELNKMTNLSDYWERTHGGSLEQNGLILKIENEIQQLEKLWTENEAQIQKLNCQDYELELKNLKLDRDRLETELEEQKDRLEKCEKDIVSCQKRISSLSSEMVQHSNQNRNKTAPPQKTAKLQFVTATGPD